MFINVLLLALYFHCLLQISGEGEKTVRWSMCMLSRPFIREVDIYPNVPTASIKLFLQVV